MSEKRKEIFVVFSSFFEKKNNPESLFSVRDMFCVCVCVKENDHDEHGRRVSPVVVRIRTPSHTGSDHLTLCFFVWTRGNQQNVSLKKNLQAWARYSEKFSNVCFLGFFKKNWQIHAHSKYVHNMMMRSNKEETKYKYAHHIIVQCLNKNYDDVCNDCKRAIVPVDYFWNENKPLYK